MTASQDRRKDESAASVLDVTESPLDAQNAKRSAILEAAALLFLENGYEAVSMDAIAARANVSKRTVYSYFAGKAELFAAIMVAHCEGMGGIALPTDDGDHDPAAVLTAYGRVFVAMITSPRAVALQRVVFAEVGRNAEIGQRFYSAGPARHCAALAEYLERANRRGDLAIADPYAAAIMFMELAKGPFHLALLCGVMDGVSKRDINAAVDSAVQTFLQAFRPPARAKKGTILL